MKKIELEPYEISRIIRENAGCENVRFVFATDVALNSWAEWAVKNPEESGVSAVAMEQFVAWDKFKEKFVIAKEDGKHSVPSLLRKFFVYDLIAQNEEAAKKGEPVFKSIINPMYADGAYSFTNWISGNLSSLKMWNESFQKWAEQNPGSEADLEDLDYLELYKRYSQFLGQDMFEPSWVDANFEESDLHFIIFYPEQLEDFCEYEEALCKAGNVEIYVLPQKHQKQKVNVYSNARLELRRTVLKIKDIVETSNGKISYADVALHVPQLDSYRPYVKREFENYGIPFVIRKGETYTVNSAGSIFQQILDCYNSNYSYDSIRALVLNHFIPWKEFKLNESLVKEGNKFHCLCNYEKGEHKDVWIKALESHANVDERELEFYKHLRKSIGAICNAASFNAVNVAWFDFKRDFLTEDFSTEANNVLSRCIVLLNELASLENDFVVPRSMKIASPYSFFVSELNEKSYRPQEKICGVSVFDYKLAACSAIKYNFVINCTQKAINISYRPVSFLNNLKRKKLNFTDSDFASEAFVRLYGKFNLNGEQTTYFSSSTEGFDGFAIPHNCFETGEINAFSELDEKDYYLNEKKWITENGEVPGSLLLKQKEQFEQWKNTTEYVVCSSNVSEAFKKCIDYTVKENRVPKNVSENVQGAERENIDFCRDPNSIKLTQADMEKFFPCPRMWLYKIAFKLKEDSLDIELLDNYVIGNILHKIMELFTKKRTKLPVISENSSAEEINELQMELAGLFDEAISSGNIQIKEQPLTFEVILSQKDMFVKSAVEFIQNFCSPENYGGYKIYSTEKWFCSKEENFGFTGKMDLILSDEDGNIYVVDFKTSNAGAATKYKAAKDTGEIENFQCAVYVTLLKRNEKPVVKMDFRNIKGATKDSAVPFKGTEEFNATLEQLKLYSQYMVGKISNYDFVPVKNFKNIFTKLEPVISCSKCNYRSICRTTYTVAGKNLRTEK